MSPLDMARECRVVVLIDEQCRSASVFIPGTLLFGQIWSGMSGIGGIREPKIAWITFWDSHPPTQIQLPRTMDG